MRQTASVTRHLALVGATATGKSALALEIARHHGDIELVSVDSMQVYRGMDIGTAKPTVAEQTEVPHHLIDLVEPSEQFTLSQFQAAARTAIADIEQRGKRALLVGGTGLYMQAVVDNYAIPGQFPTVVEALERESDTAALHARLVELDPPAAARIEPDNRRRIIRALEVTVGSGRPFSTYGPGVNAYPATDVRLLGIWLPRDVSRRRIAVRVDEMLAAGWIDEVRRLEGGGLSRTAAQALGYKELLVHLQGADLDEMRAQIVDRTRSFARRQRVWFRRDPRIEWFATGENASQLLPALLRSCSRTKPEGRI